MKSHKEIMDEYKVWISDYDKNVEPADNPIEIFKLLLLNTAITAKIEMLEWILDIKIKNQRWGEDSYKNGSRA